MKALRTVYVDARALQDPDYRFRGVGQHSASLLSALIKHDWKGERPELVALVDVAMEPLQAVHERLFDSVSSRIRPRSLTAGEAAWFVSLSPMTHDPLWAEAFLSGNEIYRIALFYDLIPLAFPERYLVQPALRMDYLIGLAWLRKFDVFASISRFSADELISRGGVARNKVFVSGVAVRPSLEPTEQDEPVSFEARRYITVSGGGDPRKNPECALIAHARSDLMKQAGVSMRVFGNYPDAMRREMREIYAANGGRATDLQFLSHLTDEELRQTYRNSLITIVPSRAEGFSIPIVESSAAGTPVLASDVGAHPELARAEKWRFDPDKPDQLRAMYEKLADSKREWLALRKSQEGLWRDYTQQGVGQRFLQGLLMRETGRVAAPAVKRAAKPSLAILTPLPPALSGVADYSAVTLRPLKAVTDLHMFTTTSNAKWEEGWASLAPVSSASFSSRQFDAMVNVIGNSSHHTEIFHSLLERGGACIAHDARQIDFYFHELGHERVAQVATKEMGRPVTLEEVARWLTNQRELPTLFLSEIVRASEPLFVHSGPTASEVQRLYGKTPVTLPFAQYREPLLSRLNDTERRRTREALGIKPGTVMLASFGIVSPDKAPDELIWTLKLLRDWGVDAELTLCGFIPPAMVDLVRGMCEDLELTDYVRTFPQVVSQETYSNYLVAADIGIQLRTYFMGGLSGALNDCIAAAMPAIANDHLAEAMAAPAYVRRIPDSLSCLLAAEAVLDIVNAGHHLKRPLQAARVFAKAHSPQAYCQKLLNGLGIDMKIDPAVHG